LIQAQAEVSRSGERILAAELTLSGNQTS